MTYPSEDALTEKQKGSLAYHREIHGRPWLDDVVDNCQYFTVDSAAATALVSVVEVLNDSRLLSAGDFIAKYKSPQIRVAIANKMISDLPSDTLGLPKTFSVADGFRPGVDEKRLGPDRWSVDSKAANALVEKVKSALALDVDASETSRAVHRVVRAMNDGECPRCHNLSVDNAMRRQVGLNGARFNLVCPICSFAISADDIDAAIKQFGGIMDENLSVFNIWRETRIQ